MTISMDRFPIFIFLIYGFQKSVASRQEMTWLYTHRSVHKRRVTNQVGGKTDYGKSYIVYVRISMINRQNDGHVGEIS